MRKNTVIGCRTVSTTSSIIGNATAIAVEFLKKQFPNDYFKKIHISEAFVPLNMCDCTDIYNSPTHTLFVSPTWSPGELSFEIPRWHKSNEFLFRNKRKYYTKVLEDFERKTFIYSIPNRIRVNFEIMIKLQTNLQAMDVCNYMTNIFDIGGFRYLNDICMQTEIPLNIIKPIFIKEGLKMDKKEDREKVLEYLKRNSYNAVSEKINPSTGNNMYAYSYKTNILIGFPDQPQMQKNEKNISNGTSTVSFNFYFEFWSPNNYVFEADNLMEESVYPLINESAKLNESNKLLFFTYLDTDFVPEQRGSLHLLEISEFVPEVNVEYDELDFSALMEDNLIDIVKRLLKEGYNVNKVLEIKILAGNKFVNEYNYKVDWEKLKVYTKDPMVNTTYNIALYGDLYKLNELTNPINGDREPYGKNEDIIKDVEI